MKKEINFLTILMLAILSAMFLAFINFNALGFFFENGWLGVVIAVVVLFIIPLYVFIRTGFLMRKVDQIYSRQLRFLRVVSLVPLFIVLTIILLLFFALRGGGGIGGGFNTG